MLKTSVLGGEAGVAGTLGGVSPHRATVLLCGTQGSLSVNFVRALQAAGFDRDHILFNEFF